MYNKKVKLAILCGGRSGEHEVSLLSTKSVIQALNRDKYDLTIIGIRKDGSWSLMDEENFLVNPGNFISSFNPLVCSF